jgi:predicted small metal-binding protein
MSSFKCKDIGMKGCNFELKDENWDEMMEIIELHNKKTHNIKEMTAEMNSKVKQALKK